MFWGAALAVTGLYVTLTAWISKRIIDSLAQPQTAIISGVHNALFFAAIYGVATLIFGFISSYAAVEVLSVKDRIVNAGDQLLMDRAAASFDITAFDVPETRDRVRLAAAGGRALPAAFSGSIDSLQQLITLIGISAILAYYHPLLVILVLAPSIPFFYMQMKARLYTFAAMVNKSPEYRRMGYYIGLMLGSGSAKEVRAYRSGGFFLGKYERVADHILEFTRLHRRKATLIAMMGGGGRGVWNRGSLSLRNLSCYAQDDHRGRRGDVQWSGFLCGNSHAWIGPERVYVEHRRSRSARVF